MSAVEDTTPADEVRETGLVEHLEEQAAHFWDVVQGETQRGHRYNTGRVTGETATTRGFASTGSCVR